jgi:hypothetical protein
MVSGHQAAGLLGFNRVPEGSFAEQLLHAEVMNLQLGAGMALAHRMAPGLRALERSLEISLSSREPVPRLNFPSPLLREPSLALAGEGRFSVPDDKPPVPENILMMSSKGGSDREITYTIEDYEALAQRAMSDEEVLDYLRILAESGDSNAIQALALAAAEGNARAVFVLRDFVQEGDPAATILLRNLDIRHLVQLATHDPEATWALHYLEELKNIDAIQVMNGFDLVEENLDSPVGTNGNGLDLFEGEEDLWSSKPKDNKGPPN